MAYGRKYLVEFLNVQNDVFHVYISEKDYEGNIGHLRGATDKTFITTQQSGDENIFTPIRAKECTINFVAENGISLLDFYSEDDEQFRVDFYCHQLNGVVIDKSLSSFFILQDSCQQEFAAEPFEVTLKGTDNIALLKNISFTSVGMPYHPDDGSQYVGKIALFDFFKIAIQQTGFGDLPLRVYSNIFENSTQDRTDSVTAEMLQETFLFTGDYLSSDGAWENLYNIIEDICYRFMFTFCQDNGTWNIYRRQESYLFTDNKIQGVEHDLTTGDKTAIELDYNWPIAFVPPADSFIDKIFLDKADHTTRIQRPFRFTKETFNYNRPALIKNADLQLPADAIPYETTTVDDIRYDKYSLATYFPSWIQRDGDTSYLEVATDLTNTPESEVERYIVTPSINDTARGVQFNPIPVSKGDVIDFSCQYRTFTDTNNLLNFGVRFVIIGTGATSYNLIDFPPIISSPHPGFVWDDIDSDEWDHGNGVHAFISDADADDIDTTQYQNYSLSGFLVTSNSQLPLIPADGMLLIEVVGTNTYSTSENTTTLWKDISLTISNYVNRSTQIIAHTHTNDQILAVGQQIKNFYDEEIKIDDSPRNTISGTLFTDAITNFDHTDTLTGEQTLISDVYFTKTAVWHRTNFDEARRLGDITTYERMHQAFKARTVIEGTIYGLRNKNSSNEWNFVSLLCLLTVDSLPTLNFIFGVLEVDWQNAIYKCVLNELYQIDDNSEPFTYNYLFQYIYKSD